jgi:hypothetical protein
VSESQHLFASRPGDAKPHVDTHRRALKTDWGQRSRFLCVLRLIGAVANKEIEEPRQGTVVERPLLCKLRFQPKSAFSCFPLLTGLILKVGKGSI